MPGLFFEKSQCLRVAQKTIFASWENLESAKEVDSKARKFKIRDIAGWLRVFDWENKIEGVGIAKLKKYHETVKNEMGYYYKIPAPGYYKYCKSALYKKSPTHC